MRRWVFTAGFVFVVGMVIFFAIKDDMSKFQNRTGGDIVSRQEHQDYFSKEVPLPNGFIGTFAQDEYGQWRAFVSKGEGEHSLLIHLREDSRNDSRYEGPLLSGCTNYSGVIQCPKS